MQELPPSWTGSGRLGINCILARLLGSGVPTEQPRPPREGLTRSSAAGGL
jgi:hypothetical protein